MGTCFKLDGVFERVIFNIFTMIENYVDAFKLLKANDICATDEELIQEYATMGETSARTSSLSMVWNHSPGTRTSNSPTSTNLNSTRKSMPTRPLTNLGARCSGTKSRLSSEQKDTRYLTE